MEVLTMLRYAFVMYDETENYEEMEAVLSKAVSALVHF
jgi:hypothetical protein